MYRFEMIDIGSEWCRRLIIRAADADAAREAYIVQCEAAGLVHGALNVIARCRTSARHGLRIDSAKGADHAKEEVELRTDYGGR